MKKKYIKKKWSQIRKLLSHIQPSINIESQWYGNEYGGFYVHSNNVDSNSIIYSFGIGEDISFDLALHNKFGSHIFCFDPTPKSIAWMNDQDLPENFSFHEIGLSAKNEIVEFYLPKNKEHVSGSSIEHQNVDSNYVVKVQMKNLQSIMEELGHNHVDILKMDIEGSEYEVLENILESNISIDQILVEFHNRFFEDGKTKSKHVLDLLKRKGFDIFAVSDSLEEVSFINRESIK